MKEPAAAAAAAAGGGGGDDATVPMTVATTHLSHLRTHTHSLSLSSHSAASISIRRLPATFIGTQSPMVCR